MKYFQKKLKIIFVIIYKIEQKLIRLSYLLYYPFISRNIKDIKVLSIKETICSLINSKKSISRFGDGEINWALRINNYGSFQKSSALLSKRLLQVLQSDNKNLEIGLPDAFRGFNQFVPKSSIFWKGILSRYWNRLSGYLNKNKLYYNANMSRFYIDYKNKSKALPMFKLAKKIWNNKNVLIVEGIYSRLGVDNGYFNNVKRIKRIECPATNAFEYYSKILNCTKRFLNKHGDFLVLIALGPTATILAYDLSNLGYRAIDIGQIDMEYTWCRMGVHKKVNIPTKYVNSYKIKDGKNVENIYNKQYNNEIYNYIR